MTQIDNFFNLSSSTRAFIGRSLGIRYTGFGYIEMARLYATKGYAA